MISVCVCVWVLGGQAGVGGVEGKVRTGSEERLKGARLREGIWGFWVARLTAVRSATSTAQLSSVHTCDCREGAMLRPSPLRERRPR